MARRAFASLVVLCLAAAASTALAQGGRVFNPTDETVAIYEFNELQGLVDGDAIPTGFTIPDLSGSGLSATVEANDAGDLKAGPGDPNFDDATVTNRECQRQTFNSPQARVAVNDDGDAFEMAPEDDFSVELYVDREDFPGAANWGILAGTWHSRTLIDDTQADPDNTGARYGYGLIRYAEVDGWYWILSPSVNGDAAIGFGGERKVEPAFQIPVGRHYVVLTVDRVAQTAMVYVDAVLAGGPMILDPTWAFTTPTGYDHGRFLMFAGEDDATRGAYRGSPQGTHLDAVRVQRKALTEDDITEIWDNIQSGAPSPASDDSIHAILTALKTNVIVDQCVSLSAESSRPGTGRTITKYEWKVGDGPFEEGQATKELAFPETHEAGIDVTVRITNDAAETSQARVSIKVKQPTVVARIAASLNGVPLPGSSLFVPKGSVLTLDGTGSETVIPAGALTCPTSAGQPVEGAAITEYRWDLDGKPLTVEDTRPSFDTAPYDKLGEFTVSLSVKNASGIQATRTSIKIKVADSQGNTTIFHNTDDTIVHFEFAGLGSLNYGDPIPSGTLVPDLSTSGLDGIVENNDGGDLTLNAGSLIYDNPAGSSPEVRRTGNGNQPRIAINEDGDAFEFTPADDFTIELFVDRETVTGGANWGILAGTWHSRNLIDDSVGNADQNGAWYGYGLIRNDKDANPPHEWAWVLSPVVDGIPRIGFGQQPEQQLQPFFDIPQGLHYVVMSVDRVNATAIAYVDGAQVSQNPAVPAEWSFTTPDGYEHARFLLFSGEDDPTRNEYRGSPAGTHIEAVRVQRVALTADQVLENWQNVCTGAGANPGEGPPPKKTFHRGDADDNGELQLTDAIRILGFLFLGGAAPPCMEAADADDNGELQLTDAIRVLGFLFLGGPPPAAPGPPPEACGSDPAGSAADLGCVSYTHC